MRKEAGNQKVRKTVVDTRVEKRRAVLHAILVGILIFGLCFGTGYLFGGLRPRARIVAMKADLEVPVYLDTQEFPVAGSGTLWVVRGLWDWEIVEIPTYSIEARDRVIGKMRK